MKRKSGFPLLLALAIIFTCAPVTTHAAQQKGIPPPPPEAQPTTISGPYRLTYILTEMDGSKRVGSQRYAIVVDANTRYRPAHLKLGTKIPITTGESTGNQIQYVDIGISIEATLQPIANGLDLSTHVNQSSIDSQQPIAKNPVIRQASLDTFVLLNGMNGNRPTVIGNVDIPGTTHMLQIQVTVNKLP